MTETNNSVFVPDISQPRYFHLLSGTNGWCSKFITASMAICNKRKRGAIHHLISGHTAEIRTPIMIPINVPNDNSCNQLC